MLRGDLYAILAAACWSVCVILMRISGFQIKAVALTLFKTTTAIPLFFVLVLIQGEPLWPEFTINDHLRLVASALLGITIADTLFAAALNRLGASLQALADCIYSPSMAAVGWLLFHEMLGPWELAGGALVISGIAVGLRKTEEVASKRDLLVGAALAAGAHIIMAFGILMVRDLFRETSVVWISGYRFLIAALGLALLAHVRLPLRRFGYEGHLRSREIFAGFLRPDTWKTMLPMTFFGPFLATIFWTAGFKYIPAGRAAIYNQLSTTFIIILATVVLKERMTRRKLLGVTLAVTGAVLVGLQR